MIQEEVSTNHSSVTVKQCVGAVIRHIHLVVLSSLLILVLGVIGVSLWPNVFRATTTILVDPQKIPERYVAATITTDPNARMNTLTQQVLSASRLQEIIDKNNLYPNMRKKRSREEVLDYMRAKTTIEVKESTEPEQGLSSFTISYEDTDRLLVASIANQLAASFIDWNLKSRQQQALGTTEFLSSELDHTKRSLEEQESQLAAFRLKHAGATPDAVNGNLQALSRLQTASEANMDAISRLDEERILLTRTRPAESRDAVPLTERGRLLQEKHRLESERWTLKRQFTDTYPDVIIVTAQLKDVNAQLAALPESGENSSDPVEANTKVRLALVEKELQRRTQQQANLQQQIQSFQGKLDAIPVLETQLAELTRNYEGSRQNYQSLLDKTLSAKMFEELERKQQAERFTVLDPAKTPEKPIKPKRMPLIAGVVFAALLLPVSTAIGIHLMSSAVRTEDELRGMLPSDVAILGTIPPIANKTDQCHARVSTVLTSIFSAIACAALVIFLLKVRPIL
jgi:polysaccharide biosynthesis transport protein